MDSGTRFLALRIFNMTRSCVLLRRFKNSSRWTFPIETITMMQDPVLIIEDVFKKHVKTDENFGFISAINILEETTPIKDSEEDYLTILYDIRYRGKVLPELPERLLYRFAESKWVGIGQIDGRSLNFAASAYVRALRKEPCL